MNKLKASVTLRGTFPHEQYRRICDALDSVGDVYNSMCTEESVLTVVLVSLHTCCSKEELKAVVRRVIDEKDIVELDVGTEEAHAEKCN